MDRFARIFFPIIGIILLLAILSGEIYYLFFYSPSNGRKPPQQSIPKSLESSPTPPNSMARYINNTIKEGGTISYTVEYKGRLTYINLQGGKLPNGNLYKIRLSLQLAQGKITSFVYSDKEADLIHVNTNINNESKTIQLSELTIGDQVTVRETYYIKDTQPQLIEARITKS